MKVIAFNGSPRKDGNTSILIEHALAPLRKEGIQTETYQLGGNLVRGCTACYQCFKRKDRRCAVEGDVINECIAKMDQADGILLGSPTYFADVTTETKALIDRAGFGCRANGDMFRRKVGAAIVAVRRCGGIHAFDSINHLFLISQMVVPGSIYWNVCLGREKGDVNHDEEGLRTMQALGENMAWLLKKLHA
jgi:multimeric flavodoxin WrbA